jgi:CubicO group peptidase (beta-lactamase class C family)
MLRRLAAAMTVIGALACSAVHANEIDPLLAKALQDPSVPAIAALVIRDGKVAEQGVRGVRALGSPAPAGLQDVWHIGSDAKAMTATMVARLVERGILSWATPLKALLPGVSMRPEFQNVTLPELLSHRAGLRDLDDTVDAKLLAAARASIEPLPAQRHAFAKTTLNEAPIGPAHGPSSYSNSDYVIVAAVVEQATGQTFEALMQQEVFGPLGMTVDFSDSKPGQVLGHRDGKPLTGPLSDNPALTAPAGRVKLTLADWALFAIDQMAGEQGAGKLLQPATYRFMHTAQGDTPAALGWGVMTTWPAAAPVKLLTHAGSNGYWYAMIGLAPATQSGVLVVTNAAEGSGAQNEATGVLMTLLAEVVRQP